MKIGNRSYQSGTEVMGILNVTPDSFYADSRVTANSVLHRALQMAEEGAAVLDVGAQSTRPGYVPVTAREEIERLKTVLPVLRREVTLPISVDTYYADAARYALDEGADLINDIWGLAYDRDMARTVAAYGASVCIMHNKADCAYADFWGEILAFLRRSVSLALDAGIEADRILLDGGIGFGKTREQNFELLNGYERLSSLGFPLLLGVSRKSMFGGRPEDRLEPTLRATALAVRKGVRFVRVHDVRENKEAIERAYADLH